MPIGERWGEEMRRSFSRLLMKPLTDQPLSAARSVRVRSVCQ
jgi:hypothetical protein